MTARLAALLAASTALATLAAAPPAGAHSADPAPRAGAVRVTEGCFTSVPEPGTSTAIDICYSLFKPRGASRRHPVPMVVHSHGWGGSRATDPAAVRTYTRAGYGVISFDQRGWGGSGGHAHAENPAFEGHDVRRLVRLVSRLPWVRQDRRGDPRLAAVGGSYGGGYQLLGAFEEQRVKGRPVFDALVPEITWFDLFRSLAPDGVVRTAWTGLLAAASVPQQALAPGAQAAFAASAVTGRWDATLPGGRSIRSFFARTGPRWQVQQGRRLDVPVLLGQGTIDTLFPLEEALSTWRRALTPAARARSLLIGYNAGHVLPGADHVPWSDPCSYGLTRGTFQDLAVRFLDTTLKQKGTGLRGLGRVHLATPAGRCTTVRSTAANRSFALGRVTSPGTADGRAAYRVARGPLRVAGSAHLTARVSTARADSQAFYGLAIGRTRREARLIQDNVMPVREPRAVSGARRRIPLPAVAVDVPAGQSLFLLALPGDPTFTGPLDRGADVVRLTRTVVHLHRVGGGAGS